MVTSSIEVGAESMIFLTTPSFFPSNFFTCLLIAFFSSLFLELAFRTSNLLIFFCSLEIFLSKMFGFLVMETLTP